MHLDCSTYQSNIQQVNASIPIRDDHCYARHLSVVLVLQLISAYLQFISQPSGHTNFILIIKNAQATLYYPRRIL